MQKLRKFLKRTERKRNDRGSTVLETVISIPLLALFAGMLAFGVAKSLIVMHENNMFITAASNAQNAMNVLQEAQSCYDLKTALNDTDLFTQNDDEDFYLSPTVSECKPNSSVTIRLEAVRKSDSQVIFETTAKNFILGGDYEETTITSEL